MSDDSSDWLSPKTVHRGLGLGTYLAPAKVNFYLELLGKRPDHYHEIATLIAPVNLYDTLAMQTLTVPKIELTSSDTTIPTDQRNLVWKAAELLQRESNTGCGVRIHLTKRIPHEAGLGGGSSDAATTLLALNELWQLQLGPNELSQLAAKLGSDVPAFLRPCATWCTSRGEIAASCRLQNVVHLVIVKPPFGLSTAAVYQNVSLDRRGRMADWEQIRSRIQEGDAEAIVAELYNRLQDAAFGLQPKLKQVYTLLMEAKPLGGMLSGSGSSVFAVCRDQADAQRVALQSGSKLCSIFPGTKVFVTQTLETQI